MAAGHAQPAKAINKEWSAALGFLGGVLVANNCGSRSYESSTVVYREYSPPPRVIYERPRYVEPPPVVVRRAPSGHYEYREQQVWVPGRWDYVETGCNTFRRVWTPGCYRTETVRVWVEDSCEVVDDYSYRR